jgi:PAS fold
MQTRNHLHSHDGSHRTAGQPPAANWSQHLGWLRFTYDDDRWVWSPRVEQMHGYRPGTVAPSTMLVLSHVHPDDVGKLAEALNDVRRTHRPFSSSHRIVDTNSHVHEVVMVGAPFHDTDGTQVGLQGFYLGRAPATTTDGREQATRRLRAVAARGHTEEWRQRTRAATRC